MSGKTAGSAVIVEDGPPPRVFDNLGEAGLVFYEVWNARETPARIDRAGGEPTEARLTLAPPKSGTRIRVLDIPVDDPATADLETVFENIGAKDAHIGATGGKHAGFHRTQSIDYGIVLDDRRGMGRGHRLTSLTRRQYRTGMSKSNAAVRRYFRKAF